MADLERFGIQAPYECGNNIHHVSIAVTLTHQQPCVRLHIPTPPEQPPIRVIKLIAIVCDQSYVKGGRMVCILGKSILNGQQMDIPGLTPLVVYREKLYLDVMPPGSWSAPHTWFAAGHTERKFFYQLVGFHVERAKDCSRGMHPIKGTSMVHVSYNKADLKNSSPIGIIVNSLAEETPDRYKLVSHADENHTLVPGYAIPARDADSFLARLVESTKDPRPELALETFHLCGGSEAPQWVVCARLHLFYSLIR